jgi:hypothetical protein
MPSSSVACNHKQITQYLRSIMSVFSLSLSLHVCEYRLVPSFSYDVSVPFTTQKYAAARYPQGAARTADVEVSQASEVR